MCEVTEERVAERIVAKILNDCAAVCVRVRLFELIGSEVREPLLEQRNDLMIPREIDELLVSQHRIGVRISAAKKQHYE